jgi:hypothetical protein
MDKLRLLSDERGVALPMAMITLVLLTTLMLAFAAMSQTEPVIAGNQHRVSQARAQAESGLEHAVWALTAGNVLPGDPLPAGALANPMPSSPAAAPFNGVAFTSMGTTGGYTVQVTTPDPVNRPLQRDIVAVGWTPTNAVTDTRTKAHRRITASVQALPDFTLDAPCVLCVRGDVAVAGSSLVDSRTDSDCGSGVPKYGAYTAGTLDQAGTSNIRGQAGTTTGGNVAGVDYVTNQPTTTFDEFAFNNDHLNSLKDLAKKNGTYFGPGYPNGTAAGSPTYTGAVAFNSGNKVKSGIVFLDTTTGQNIVTCTASSPPGCVNTPESQFASLSISGNPFLDPEFTGMLVVNGRLSISGNMKIAGLVYVMDDLTYNGTGTGEISGLVISQNVRNTTATSISDTDTTSMGNSRIKLNCANARGAGRAPRTFSVISGTYRETQD